jgi:hypothetical protein
MFFFFLPLKVVKKIRFKLELNFEFGLILIFGVVF